MVDRVSIFLDVSILRWVAFAQRCAQQTGGPTKQKDDTALWGWYSAEATRHCYSKQRDETFSAVFSVFDSRDTDRVASVGLPVIGAGCQLRLL